MTDEERQKALDKLLNRYDLYAELCLKIKTKSGDILPLIFNDAQKQIHEALEKQLAETGKIRAVILKGRQQGASTYTEGRFYWRTSLLHGKQAFILTHEQAATDNIFGMAKRYHDNCVDAFKPATKSANAKELWFENRDSGYKVGTAGSKAVGRSGTIQYFHASEAAFWPNADLHFAGVVQCVPDEPGTEIIIESTANGVGGKFYELWTRAINGESEFIPIFVPWFITQEYRSDASNLVLTADEKQKKALYKLDDEQLAWRRKKEQQLGKDLCDQEYPYCWQDAFLASGRTVFDKDLLKAAELECFRPLKRMALENGRFVEHKKGELRVWDEPEVGSRYVIGADVAEGLEHGDYSVADVRKLPNGEQVAQWHGHIAPDLFAKNLYALGKYYNHALIGCEANNHGITVNISLRDAQYPNLYVQKAIDDRGSHEKETRRIGWMTTSKSKPYIIDQLAAELREKTHGIVCKETIHEMQTYIVESNGSYNAKQDCYDDRVMSFAIAGEMLRLNPGFRKSKM